MPFKHRLEAERHIACRDANCRLAPCGVPRAGFRHLSHAAGARAVHLQRLALAQRDAGRWRARLAAAAGELACCAVHADDAHVPCRAMDRPGAACLTRRRRSTDAAARCRALQYSLLRQELAGVNVAEMPSDLLRFCQLVPTPYTLKPSVVRAPLSSSHMHVVCGMLSAAYCLLHVAQCMSRTLTAPCSSLSLRTVQLSLSLSLRTVQLSHRTPTHLTPHACKSPESDAV